MKNLDEFRGEFVTNYRNELKNLLENMEEPYRPSQDRIKKIIDNSSKLLAVDDLLLSQFVGNSDVRGFHLPHIPKIACILSTMAIGAAIVAAWVMSGGTLVVGTVVVGVKITSAILAALVGGATGRAIAEIICK